MSIPKSPETPLYYLVPSRPDLARITKPLQEKVLVSITQAFLSGKIDYRLRQELLRRYNNRDITTLPGKNELVEIWDINHPSLIKKEDK